MEQTPEEEAGSMLSVDLDEVLGQYVRERVLIVELHHAYVSAFPFTVE
jgi:hypothetical protein